jgi:hypothetical protein
LWGNAADVIFTDPYVYLSYNKASWIYHQLNCLLGRELNLNILGKLLEEHQFANIDALEFRDFYKKETQNLSLDFDVDTYFNNYLFGAGHPLFDCQTIALLDTTRTDTALYNVKLVLTQTQNAENVADVFVQPLNIIFIYKNKIVHSERVVNEQKVQEFSFTDIPQFDVCKVDTLRTLCQNISITTKIDDELELNKLIVFPNPAINQQFINIMKPEILPYHNDKIIINDILGNPVKIGVIELDALYQLNISALNCGVYFVRIDNKTTFFTIIK